MLYNVLTTCLGAPTTNIFFSFVVSSALDDDAAAENFCALLITPNVINLTIARRATYRAAINHNSCHLLLLLLGIFYKNDDDACARVCFIMGSFIL